MAEYAEREKRFNNSLPEIVGNFMRSVSRADGEARMESVEITKAIVEMPNITLEQKIDILNRNQPFVYAASLPSVTYAEPRPFLAEEITLEMSMNVSAHTETEKSVDSLSEGHGEATFGWGFIKGKIGMKASVSTHSNKKRSSDYSATTDMKLRMTRHPLPEGLAKTLDAMNDIQKAVNEINVAIALQEIASLANEKDLQLPEPTTEPEEAPDEKEA